LSFLSTFLRDVESAGWMTIISTIADLTLVGLAVYWVIMLSKRRPAWQILWGLLVFFGLVWLTDRLQLHTLNFLLKSFLYVLPVAIVILFQPELRQMLENMGSVAGWGRDYADGGGHLAYCRDHPLRREDVRAQDRRVDRDREGKPP
jgi:DNA integrity scanning protein DisA with diadenylate cyclase activity